MVFSGFSLRGFFLVTDFLIMLSFQQLLKVIFIFYQCLFDEIYSVQYIEQVGEFFQVRGIGSFVSCLFCLGYFYLEVGIGSFWVQDYIVSGKKIRGSVGRVVEGRDELVWENSFEFGEGCGWKGVFL